jgi:hypothetical protein
MQQINTQINEQYFFSSPPRVWPKQASGNKRRISLQVTVHLSDTPKILTPILVLQ